MRSTSAVWAMALLGLAGACSAETEEREPEVQATLSQQAHTAFWEAFWRADYSRIEVIKSELEAALQDEPDDAYTTLLLAHANLWALAEYDVDPSQPPEAQQTLALDAMSYFNKAHELDPDDPRLLSWVGGLEYTIGRITENDALKALGREKWAQAIELMPEFTYASRGFTLGGLPASDPEYAEAVESLWKTTELCFGAVDHANPDYSARLQAEAVVGSREVCWNSEKVPHNLEGFFLSFGDMLVKYGDTAAARVMLANARALPSFGTWKHAAIVDDLLSSDLEARAALFRDGDPDNDPSLAAAPHNCTVCHGR